MSKRVTVNISRGLHKEFKSAVAKRGVTITDVIRDLIIKWLSEQAREKTNAPNND